MLYGGGPGYVHVPNVVLPLMKEKGLSEEQIHAITVKNPARALSIY
jgi:predicted metal-dependent phosphotriesterase family hydrolase